MITLGLIGAGNIMGSRHLPALKLHPDRFSLAGIADLKGDRSAILASKFELPRHDTVSSRGLRSIPWLSEVDAVIIATPPLLHYRLVKEALQMGKHVLVEKPFVVDLAEGAELVSLARKKNLMLAVNHNFQFSRGFSRLSALLADGSLGSIRSFYNLQVTNDQRRLPVWADDLPWGLFYDETPHLFYLLRKFGGPVTVRNVFRVKSAVKRQTPKTLTMDFSAGDVPASVYINFESPVCEWYFAVFGEKQTAYVDLFRDIITVLPNDGQHLMKEVFKSSIKATVDHWSGFVANGWQYIRHRLHYGMDETHRRFHDAVTTGDASLLAGMAGADGLEVNRIQHEVMNY